MNKFALALVWTLVIAGYAIADEFTAMIIKVEGTTVTLRKPPFDPNADSKKANAEAAKASESAKLAANARIAKAELDLAAGGFGKKAGPAKNQTTTKNLTTKAFPLPLKQIGLIEGGLNNQIFTKIDEKGVFGVITTNERGEITQILIIDFMPK